VVGISGDEGEGGLIGFLGSDGGQYGDQRALLDYMRGRGTDLQKRIKAFEGRRKGGRGQFGARAQKAGIGGNVGGGICGEGKIG